MFDITKKADPVQNSFIQKTTHEVKNTVKMTAGLFLGAYVIKALGLGVAKLGDGVSYIGQKVNDIGSFVNVKITPANAASGALAFPIQRAIKHVGDKIAGSPDPQTLEGKTIAIWSGIAAYHLAGMGVNAIETLFTPISPPASLNLTLFNPATMCAPYEAPVPPVPILSYIPVKTLLGITAIQLLIVLQHKLQQYKECDDADLLKSQFLKVRELFQSIQTKQTKQISPEIFETMVLNLKTLNENSANYESLKKKISVKGQMQEIELMKKEIESQWQQVLQIRLIGQIQGSLNHLQELTESLKHLNQNETAQIHRSLHETAINEVNALKIQLQLIEKVQDREALTQRLQKIEQQLIIP